MNRPKGNRRTLVFGIAAVAAMGGLLFGYDTGVISGALLFLKRQFTLSPLSQETVVSSVLVGCIIGAALSGRLADRWGRRNLILMCAAVFLAGALVTALADGVKVIITGRVLIGLAIGAASFAVPLYISEIAPPSARGALVSLNQLMITIGIVVSYLADDCFAQLPQNWRYMFGSGVAPAVALGLGMLFLPQSPRWLLSRRRSQKARDVLARTLGPEAAEREVGEIRATLESEAAGSPAMLWSPWVRPALAVGVLIMLFQQATGINTVIYYAPTIFEMAGFTSDTAAISATVGVGLVNVLFTVVSIWLLDRWGRKPLLSLGLAGMVISLAALGLAFHLQGDLGPSLKWVAVGSITVYIASFAVSLGPIAWLLIAEIYPLQIRGRAMGLATLANWLFNFLVAMSFLSIIELLGKAGAFWLYGAIGMVGWFFCRWYVPETRGATLEQIEANLKAGRRTRDLGQPL